MRAAMNCTLLYLEASSSSRWPISYWSIHIRRPSAMPSSSYVLHKHKRDNQDEKKAIFIPLHWLSACVLVIGIASKEQSIWQTVTMHYTVQISVCVLSMFVRWIKNENLESWITMNGRIVDKFEANLSWFTWQEYYCHQINYVHARAHKS